MSASSERDTQQTGRHGFGDLRETAVDKVTRLTRELARSEARFRDVIERNADAIVVVDATGIIRFVNQAATSLFERTRQQLIGSAFGFPVLGGETTELELVRGGRPRTVEMRVVASEWEGGAAFIASLRDMTERKNAEETARRLALEQTARATAEDAVARLSFLLESTTVFTSSLNADAVLENLARLCVGRLADWAVIYAVASDGSAQRTHVVHADPAKAAVATALQSVRILPRGPHPVLDVIQTRRRHIVSSIDDTFIDSVTSDTRERELVRALGLTSYVLLPVAAHDRVFGALALAASTPARQFTPTDVALADDLAARAGLAVENATLYEEANVANRGKADLLAVVSHDLRTPLNAIIGYADLLDLGLPEPIGERSKTQVGRIRTSARHLVYLLDELLDFARLDAGGVTIRRSRIDALVVLREVRDVMEPLAAKAGLSLVVDAADTPQWVITDADKLRQILLNLVGNAIKYTRHGTITIGVRDGDRLRISVHDTGIGIAPENLSRVFEPFWQVDPSERARHTGTGLGLSVVRRLAELLGGEVTVESRVVDGSTFVVALPSTTN